MVKKSIEFLNGLVTEDTPKKDIDIIEFIKRCVREHKEEEKPKAVVAWEGMFETLWKMYPRKVNKILAKKTFEHKIRGLTEEECRQKANFIWVAEKKAMKIWHDNATEMQYIPHYSSWLNANVNNSKHYKGK